MAPRPGLNISAAVENETMQTLFHSGNDLYEIIRQANTPGLDQKIHPLPNNFPPEEMFLRNSQELALKE